MTPTHHSAHKEVRVRMAPSPTGSLHIGGVRTALYNMLFARQHGGKFILRIEDTDEARSTKEFEQDILDSFAWVGVQFDEGVMPDGSSRGEHGPYRQTERLDLYEQRLRTLLDENKAYHCFCSPEELEAQRQSQAAAGGPQIYSGKCRSVSHKEVAERLAGGEAAVIRLKVPTGTQTFTDLIRGEVAFDNQLIGDIVIAKSLRQPLYNFAVVIDDATMNISHVIRGEEHLANTPKQLLIAHALGITPPRYAHVPIILSATGKGKMSKRDGGTTVREYREAGYLPEAMLNFLVLLGWHPEGDREVLTMAEMEKEFSLERVQKGGARFDKKKLDFFNAQYLRALPQAAVVSLLSTDTFSEASWRRDAALFDRVVALLQSRLVTLADFRALAEPVFNLPAYADTLLLWKEETAAAAKENLQRARDLLQELPDQLFTVQALGPKLMALADQHGRGSVLWPLRVALSGRDSSPPPPELLAVLGKTESLARIDTALQKLA